MKREIDCRECSAKWRDHPDDRAMGIKIRKVLGVTLRDLVCDQCATPLPKGTSVVAVSVFKPNGYFRWEQDYIEMDPTQVIRDELLGSGWEPTEAELANFAKDADEGRGVAKRNGDS